MAYSESAKKATNKYMAEKRDKLNLNFPKGAKEKYRAYAESKGMSLTALFVQLIEEDMAKNENL